MARQDDDDDNDIYIYIYIYIYIERERERELFGPVKLELGVIPSGQKKKKINKQNIQQ